MTRLKSLIRDSLSSTDCTVQYSYNPSDGKPLTLELDSSEYTVDQSSETTLIWCRPLCLLNEDI